VAIAECATEMTARDIEKYVLQALDHVGWYRSCWFPRVERDSLNFPDGPDDEEVRAALFRLVESGAVVVSGASSKAEAIEDIRTNPESEYELELSEEARQQLYAAQERAKVSLPGYFRLFAQGAEFDVDEYLRSTSLTFDQVWRRGEGSYAMNGVAKRLGDGAALSWADQQTIAARFMAENREALQALSEFPGVQQVTLGLQFNIDLQPGLLGFAVTTWQHLLRCALDARVSPTIYVHHSGPGGPLPYTYSPERFLEGW
jgi:hypothetical protein